MKRFFPALLITLIAWTNVYSQIEPDAGVADPVVLENFFDGLMNDHLRSKHVAGAVVAVVKDGNMVFTKGYGYSDYAGKKPVSPDSTLFRIGSISKTFTWTAVMQLVEQGKLNLDEDVNDYLKDFKIPECEGGPVTLRHLMTHTPGFEDRLIGIFANDKKALKPFGEILKEQLPERVRPAGVEMSYSNHGTGIAAYIVEQVSGLSWEEYVERNILQPLGMDHTTFRQPLPEHLSGMESKGYNFENGAFKEYGFEFIPLSAVGGGSSTASDISKFMITHLQLGKYKNVRILDSVSSSSMQAVEFRVSPYVSGIGLGLYELVNWNGIRTTGHGGDTFWFHSLMALIPEKNLGL
jgi:CubicO group peptidase (beta-lactamase class C family)